MAHSRRSFLACAGATLVLASCGPDYAVAAPARTMTLVEWAAIADRIPWDVPLIETDSVFFQSLPFEEVHAFSADGSYIYRSGPLK